MRREREYHLYIWWVETYRWESWIIRKRSKFQALAKR